MKPRNLIVLASFLFSISAAAQTAPPADSAVKLLSAPVFNMSDAAVAAGIEGNVVMGLTVEKNGEVKDVFPSAGPIWPCNSTPTRELEDLFAKLGDNVRSSKFSPAIKSGGAVSSTIALTIDLDKSPQLANRYTSAKGKPPLLVSGNVVNGRAVSLPKPAYPAAARRERARGAVSIRVLIDEVGNVIKAGATKGDPLLQGAARAAACGAKFSPTKLMNEPVKVSGIITYNFVP